MWGVLETLRPSEKVTKSDDTARCTIVHISGNGFLAQQCYRGCAAPNPLGAL